MNCSVKFFEPTVSCDARCCRGSTGSIAVELALVASSSRRRHRRRRRRRARARGTSAASSANSARSRSSVLIAVVLPRSLVTLPARFADRGILCSCAGGVPLAARARGASAGAARRRARARRRAPAARPGSPRRARPRRRRRCALRMKSPSVSTPASGAIVAVAMMLIAAGPDPAHDRRHRERQLDPADHLELAHPHPPRRLDRAAVDLADADEGVGEDRRDPEDHQRDRHVEHADADEGDHAARSAPSSGIARPALPIATASLSPLPRWPRQTPDRQRDRERDRERQQGDLDLRPARARSTCARPADLRGRRHRPREG